MFAEDFAGRIMPFDEQAARAFAEIAVGRRFQGRPISEFDAQITSIAKANRALPATRNTVDFEGCGVRLVNPRGGLDYLVLFRRCAHAWSSSAYMPCYPCAPICGTKTSLHFRGHDGAEAR
jgi:hypothetical protein